MLQERSLDTHKDTAIRGYSTDHLFLSQWTGFQHMSQLPVDAIKDVIYQGKLKIWSVFSNRNTYLSSSAALCTTNIPAGCFFFHGLWVFTVGLLYIWNWDNHSLQGHTFGSFLKFHHIHMSFINTIITQFNIRCTVKMEHTTIIWAELSSNYSNIYSVTFTYVTF